MRGWGGGGEVPLETRPIPAGLPLLQLCALQPCTAREVFWAGNVTPDCSGGKCDLWMQSRLHRCSSCSFPPLYKPSLSLPEGARYCGTPHPCLTCCGQRRCGDIFVTGPQPALSLQGSHPRKAIIGGLQVTSANHPSMCPPCAVSVGSGFFTFPKVQLATWA